jgi:dTDP-4-dehydrorhamnose reductase
LREFLATTRPEFLINTAGYTGKPNVDACEIARAETLRGNTLLPQTVAQACEVTKTPWAHVSSGCIYTGAKIVQGAEVRVAPDLTTPESRSLVERQDESVRGFTEEDEPNFSFRQPPCSFYSGSKALAEEALAGAPACYILRLRIPFDEFDGARNYLSKVQRYAKVYDNTNSITHRGDFTRTCLALWDRRAPFGVYNVVNPGYITTREVIEAIQRILRPARAFEFWASDEEFYRVAAKTPRSNCILDASKLASAGIELRPVREAVEASLRQWRL